MKFDYLSLPKITSKLSRSGKEALKKRKKLLDIEKWIVKISIVNILVLVEDF